MFSCLTPNKIILFRFQNLNECRKCVLKSQTVFGLWLQTKDVLSCGFMILWLCLRFPMKDIFRHWKQRQTKMPCEMDGEIFQNEMHLKIVNLNQKFWLMIILSDTNKFISREHWTANTLNIHNPSDVTNQLTNNPIISLASSFNVISSRIHCDKIECNKWTGIRIRIWFIYSSDICSYLTVPSIQKITFGKRTNLFQLKSDD